jgi:hypothetical protein
VLIVERPKAEALDATMLAFNIGEDQRPKVGMLFDLYEQEFAALEREANTLVLPWTALDHEGAAELAWRHLLPGVPFDAHWHNHLRPKRITER